MVELFIFNSNGSHLLAKDVSSIPFVIDNSSLNINDSISKLLHEEVGLNVDITPIFVRHESVTSSTYGVYNKDVYAVCVDTTLLFDRQYYIAFESLILNLLSKSDYHTLDLMFEASKCLPGT